VLYLAEVHKKTGFMGTKAELKLLACKQSDQSWAPVAGDDQIPTDAANDYNAGVLVLAELDGKNQQVQTIQDASRQLVSILTSFSRIRERFRTQEDEIEGWKQSLIYQSQELTRREVDIEVRTEELQALEAAAKDMEQQVQAVEASRQEVEALQEQVDRDRQQVEEAWERLNNSQGQSISSLSAEHFHHIETLLGQLETTANGTAPNRELLQKTLETLDQYQAQLDHSLQAMDSDRAQAQHLQSDVDRQTHELAAAWQAWHQTQDSLTQAKLDLQLQEQSLELKTAHKSTCLQQSDAQSELYQLILNLKHGVGGDSAVDIIALQNMPLSELEAIVQQLNQELLKLSSFVNDQEEELELQQQSIDALQEKINQASEYDRLSLAGDLEDEQQHYRLLNETLKGQRQTLQEREEILKIHEELLHQRTHNSQNPDQTMSMQLDMTLQQLEAQQQQLLQDMQALDAQIQQLQTAIDETRTTLERTSSTQASERTRLQDWEHYLQQQQISLAEQWAKVNPSAQLQQPMQGMLATLMDQLSSALHQNGHSTEGIEGSQPQQTVAELKTLLTQLKLGN
jgi:DNA repair exonuclease SbcCD ATPase subunit